MQPRIVFPEHLGHTMNRVRSLYRLHERVYALVTLYPSLFRQRVISCNPIVFAQLVRPPVTRFLTDGSSSLDHLPDQCLRTAPVIARHLGEVCAERAHRAPHLFTESIGRHELQSIAERGANESERYTGAAPGVFDHRAAWLKQTLGDGCADHRPRHPVLHAARRIRPLDLRQNPRVPRRNYARQLDDRSVPDRVDDPGSLHRITLTAAGLISIWISGFGF